MYYAICVILGKFLALLGLPVKYDELNVVGQVEIKGFKNDNPVQ